MGPDKTLSRPVWLETNHSVDPLVWFDFTWMKQPFRRDYAELKGEPSPKTDGTILPGPVYTASSAPRCFDSVATALHQLGTADVELSSQGADYTQAT